MSSAENTQLVLICGKSATGKSASLMPLENQERIVYLNCENNKRLPFRSNMNQKNVTDPTQVLDTLIALRDNADYDAIVIDTLTFMMDMYETQHVLPSSNTMGAWGEYAQFFKRIMQEGVAKMNKSVIFTAHTTDDMIGEGLDASTETFVKVKGSLNNNGIESYFSTIVATKKVPIKKLEDFKNDLLIITPEEEAIGFKYVFQTRLTKDTVNERIRSPLGMWDLKETYIDNNAQFVLNRLKEYYS